jgi:hypothetical protein
MTRKKELLIDEALRLPEEDRADLAAKLIESLDGDPDNNVDAAWAQESSVAAPPWTLVKLSPPTGRRFAAASSVRSSVVDRASSNP